MTRIKSKQIAPALLAWFDEYGRKNLPWQINKTPYRVWVSEVMLQQTQVSTVLTAFERFINRFPDCASLAAAPEDDVLHLWSGLGYYSRARNSIAARAFSSINFRAYFQRTVHAAKFTGIGRSTAGAILAIASGKKEAILDGNVKRVLTRRYGISTWPAKKETEKQLWHLAEQMTPTERTADYTQASWIWAPPCVHAVNHGAKAAH